MVESRSGNYSRFYGENYGWQPCDKFKEVAEQVKSKGIEFNGWHIASGEMQGTLVTVMHDSFEEAGVEELTVEIVEPNKTVWAGRLISDRQTGIVSPSYSQKVFGGEVQKVGLIHPRSIRKQSLAVSSMLRFIQEAIPQIANK